MSYHVNFVIARLCHIMSCHIVTLVLFAAHLAAEFNILPGRWQHVWLVDIVPHKIWGKWTEIIATQHGGTLRR
jgi:hypothetical protein